MAQSLLVLSLQPNFATLLSKSLRGQPYEVYLTADFSEAIKHVRHNECTVALLDAEIEDVDISVFEVMTALQQLHPDIQFILAVREGQIPDLGGISPLATFTKPIQMADLQAAISRGMKRAQSATESGSDPTGKFLAETQQLLWLKDVSRAAQHLTRLTLESSAQAALITHTNELWAYAGQLSREAAQELGRSVQKYWDAEAKSDLLRFVRLESTDAQHMLYATRLSESMILALVFDAETPFSTIRSQASKLARSLAETTPEELTRIDADDVPPALPPMLLDEDEEDRQGLPLLSEILGQVPPPNPEKQDPGQSIPVSFGQENPIPVMKQIEPVSASSPVAVESSRMSNSVSRESSPPVPVPSRKVSLDDTVVSRRTQFDADLLQAAQDVPPDLQVTRKQGVSAADEPETDPESLIDTRVSGIPASVASVTEVAHRIVLEPASSVLYNLNYACLMVPRFENHHLVGDLAERLSEWVPQICVAFGWRLEHFAIRPEYMQWVVSVPPNTAPGYLMRITRQQTSDRIFVDFPRFKQINPSGDFWAPGYLIMGGSQPHPQDMVRKFIQQTRNRQGITAPRK